MKLLYRVYFYRIEGTYVYIYQARLGGSEGRVRALDAQLSQLETAKKEVEQKLSSVGSTLRRIAGIQMDGSVNMPFKLMSPSRRWSPARGNLNKISYFDSQQQYNNIKVYVTCD